MVHIKKNLKKKKKEWWNKKAQGTCTGDCWAAAMLDPDCLFFIYLSIWLCQVLVAACGIFVAVHGLLSSFGAQALEHSGLITPRPVGS